MGETGPDKHDSNPIQPSHCNYCQAFPEYLKGFYVYLCDKILVHVFKSMYTNYKTNLILFIRRKIPIYSLSVRSESLSECLI